MFKLNIFVLDLIFLSFNENYDKFQLHVRHNNNNNKKTLPWQEEKTNKYNLKKIKTHTHTQHAIRHHAPRLNAE